jgi:hypothetical protein
MPVIAGGGVEDDFVRGEEAAAFAVEDHVERRAVFDAAAGVRELGFAVEFDARQVGSEAVEPEERRIADGVDQVHLHRVTRYVFAR